MKTSPEASRMKPPSSPTPNQEAAIGPVTQAFPPVTSQEAGGAQAQAMLVLIGRLATDPTADLNKLEKFMDLQERIMQKAAEAEFARALSAFQGEAPLIAKSKAIGFYSAKMGKNIVKGHYCPYGALMEQIQPILTRHGFSIEFTQVPASKDGLAAVAGWVRHRAGHKEPVAWEFPLDPSGEKTPIQAIASSISYAKRYVVTSFFNLRLADEDEMDDDGNLKGARKPATKTEREQAQQEPPPPPPADKRSLADVIAQRNAAHALTDEQFNRIAGEISEFRSLHWRRLKPEWLAYLAGDEGWAESLKVAERLEIDVRYPVVEPDDEPTLL